MTGLVRHDACTTLGPGTRASTTTGTAAAAGSPALAAGTYVNMDQEPEKRKRNSPFQIRVSMLDPVKYCNSKPNYS